LPSKPEKDAPTITTSIVPTVTPIPTPGIGSTLFSEVDGMVMVHVPAGEFLMGSTDLDADARSYEKPQHTVYLNAFWIDKTEVTNAMYALCVNAGVCRRPASNGSATRSSYFDNPGFDNYPVIYVSWNEASDYCAWAGRRLPTEAEWEKAARGTNGRIFPWGNGRPEGPRPPQLNFNNWIGDTSEVSSYLAGASHFRALHMAGNVREWVADWYESDYYSHSPSENPPGPSTGDFRVMRGGAWHDLLLRVRSAHRLWFSPEYRDATHGFRCAQDAGQLSSVIVETPTITSTLLA